MLTHDVIKTMYTREGYLPDYPYHLISDSEMISAFIKNASNFFDAKYPCPTHFESEYLNLKNAIIYHVDSYLADRDPDKGILPSNRHVIPDWVYSYMLGAVVGPESHEQDRHDLFVLLQLDNIEDEFTPDIYKKIFRISERWNYKLTSDVRQYRPPTLFGESHVIKSLRLDEF